MTRTIRSSATPLALALAAVIVVAAPFTATPAGAQTDPQAPSIGDVSYALGHDLGREIAAGLALDDVTPDLQQLVLGFSDGLENKHSTLTRKQIDRTLITFNRIVQERKNQQRLATDPVFKALYEENLRKSNQFLERFAEKDGAKSLDSGIDYLVINQGAGDSPTKSDTVVATFRALLIDGYEIASGTRVQVDIDAIEQGFQQVLTSMKVGDRWYAAIPPDLAFAGVGRAPDIGPNEAIVVDVTLHEIVDE